MSTLTSCKLESSSEAVGIIFENAYQYTNENGNITKIWIFSEFDILCWIYFYNSLEMKGQINDLMKTAYSTNNFKYKPKVFKFFIHKLKNFKQKKINLKYKCLNEFLKIVKDDLVSSQLCGRGHHSSSDCFSRSGRDCHEINKYDHLN